MTPQKDMSQIEYKNAINSINGYFTFQLMSRDYISSVSLIGERWQYDNDRCANYYRKRADFDEM